MQMRNGGPITDVAVDRTGFRIAAVSDVNCELNVWDLRNRNCLARMQNVHRSMPTSCEFTPDNRSIITTSTDGSVKSIDYECGRALITLRDHKHAVSSACLTTDGRLLATTSWDRSILLYDLQTGAYRNQGPTVLTGAHQGSISCSSMSAAGDILVTGGLDKLIIVWDPDKGHHVLSLNGHKDWVNTVKISTDERVVLSASKDKTIRLWDVLSRERMTTGTMVDTHAKVNKSKTSRAPPVPMVRGRLEYSAFVPSRLLTPMFSVNFGLGPTSKVRCLVHRKSNLIPLLVYYTMSRFS
ncbi:unnamed protein product [Echinostoma caproni]|uniref:WD_REPEATS_REGION domain-containing protein n=1 Tax=Echinostoma caproni TaxID=27848 RepID=A0A182ZZY7_9TREM|nr:unnamed protein product [Echinostoma caproni]